MNGSSDRPGWRARPAHPPLTSFPLAAYVFTAAFDVVSAAGGGRRPWALQLWHAGTFVLIGGLGICLLAMGTGFWDLFRFPARSPDAVRTAVLHVCVMAGVFMLGAGDVAWRLSLYSARACTPVGLVALSVAAAAGVCAGAFFGGQLVFGHGLGVRPEESREPG